MLPAALDVMGHWGFEFKTIGFVWAKSYKDHDWVGDTAHPIGTGYWTRANPELCLFGTKGKPKRLSRAVRKLIVAPRREHSRKPDEIYGRIEALCEGPYLEMFARFPRAGWDRIGAQDGIEQRRWKSNSYPGEEAVGVQQL
jgi:N6-adenosine-specific RNA methylase IME4